MTRAVNRTKQVFNGLVSSYIFQALVMGTGLWLTPFLLHHLGQHDYGLWITALQILTYLALADFGIVALLPRSIAYATGRARTMEGPTDLPKRLGVTALVVLAQTPFIAIIATLVVVLLPTEWRVLHGPISLIAAAFVLLFPLRVLPAILEGLQEQVFVVRLNMVSWFVGTVSNVLMIMAGCGLYSLPSGWIISQAITTAACGYRVLTTYPHLLPRSLPRLKISELFRQMGGGFWVSMNQFGQILMAGTDVLIISRVFGPEFAVPYVCTAKLSTVLANQPQMLMHLAMPGLSELKAGASKERLFQVTIALSQGLLFLSGLLACVILVVNRGFVGWWVGSAQYAGFLVTCLLLIQMVLRHWSLTFVYAVFCFGYERMLAIVGFLDGLFTAVAMYLLIRRFHYVGVVLGSILAVCLTSLPANLICIARELNVSVRGVLAPFWSWFWRFALLASGAALAAIYRPPQTIIQMLAAAAIVTGVYFAVMFNSVLQSPLGPYVRRGGNALQVAFPKLYTRYSLSFKQGA